jgi:hypothetical protein
MVLSPLSLAKNLEDASVALGRLGLGVAEEVAALTCFLLSGSASN